MYQIVVHPRANKFFRSLMQKELQPVVEKIRILRVDPFTKKINIKKMANSKHSYRLKIRKIRVIYELNLIKKVILYH